MRITNWRSKIKNAQKSKYLGRVLTEKVKENAGICKRIGIAKGIYDLETGEKTKKGVLNC